jgi:TusA-related sulfurtransferase
MENTSANSSSNSSSNASEKLAKKVDCIGMYCPVPIFMTRKAIDEVNVGELVEILADDPAAESDIKSWVKRTGHELVHFEENDGVFRFIIRKTK